MLRFLLSIADESDHEKILYVYNNFHEDMLEFAKYQLYIKGQKNIEDDSNDIVQSAFLRITKYIKSIDFSVEKSSLKTYIFTIVVNEVNKFLNDKQHVESLEDHFDLVSDDDFIERIRIRETYDKVVEEIKKLDDIYSITMMYRYLDDKSVKQIASFMEVPEKTVYTRLERGKILVLEEMKKYDV